MENITTAAELKNAIQLLEVEQAIDARNLKDQFYITYESLKPVNLFRNTLYEVISTPNLVDNILGTAAGLVTGYLSKKIVIGASGNILRKLFGSVMQLGVTNIVTQHPDTVKSIGQYIIQNILHKKRIEK